MGLETGTLQTQVGGRREGRGTKERKVTPLHTSQVTVITSTNGEGDCVS